MYCRRTTCVMNTRTILSIHKGFDLWILNFFLLKIEFNIYFCSFYVSSHSFRSATFCFVGFYTGFRAIPNKWNLYAQIQCLQRLIFFSLRIDLHHKIIHKVFYLWIIYFYFFLSNYCNKLNNCDILNMPNKTK